MHSRHGAGRDCRDHAARKRGRNGAERHPDNPNSKNVLTLAVYGDSPYGTSPTDTVQTEKIPAFIDSINKDPKVDLVLHIGDIHSGSQYCTESYDRTIADLWTGSRTRSSTPPATTSGRTATRRSREDISAWITPTAIRSPIWISSATLLPESRIHAGRPL